MKLNRDLIDKHISDSDKQDFLKFARTKIDYKRPTGFAYFWITWALLVELIIFVIGIIVFVVGAKSGSNSTVAVISFILIVISVVGLFFSLYSRSKKIHGSSANIRWQELTNKWFSYYGIKEDGSFKTEIKKGELINIAKKFSRAPSDADMSWISEFVGFVDESVSTIIFVVKWHWVRERRNSKGNVSRRHHYMDQTYIVDNNLKTKWNKFEFKLAHGSLLSLPNKKETLESRKFNKDFNYEYNDPIKLRIAFTPYVQETLIKKYEISSLGIYKTGKRVVTTSSNTGVAGSFSPLVANSGILSLKEKVVKDKMSRDILNDYIGITKMIAHARLIYPLFK